MKLAKIGSIGEGLRDVQTMLEVFSDALEELSEDYQELIAVARELVFVGLRRWTPEQDALASDTLSELEDALNSHSPDYCSFGAARGDPSNFGFWVNWDILDSDSIGRHAAVMKVPAGDTWPPLQQDTEYVLEINDHGNAVLYNAANRQEIWSVI